MPAEWEEKSRIRIQKPYVVDPIRIGLQAELDRTIQKLREIDHYETGPTTISPAIVIEGELIYGYELRKKFFSQAKADTAVTPLSADWLKTLNKINAWNRDLDITDRYLNPAVTLQELATQKGLTSEMIRVIAEKTLMRLWVYSSSQTQRLYPFFLLPQDKPETLERAINRSERGTGSIAKVIFMINQGANYAELLEKIGGSGINSARAVLDKYGVKVPHYNESSSSQVYLMKQLAATTELEEIKRLLNQVSRYGIGLINNRTKALTSLMDLVYTAGFRKASPRDTSHFIKSLEDAGIPYRSMPAQKNSEFNYIIIASSTQEKAQKALLEDPNLIKFYGSSVEQIAGPTSKKLPITADFMRKSQFISPLHVLKELGLKIDPNSKSYRHILNLSRQDSPVEIYGRKERGKIRSYSIPTSKKDQFKDYLREKLVQIGIQVTE